MRITPLDVRKQEFAKSMRGFDCDEVRAYLATLADEYEAVLVDNKQTRERSLALEDKLQDFQRLEKQLRDTLLTAERMTQEARETAAREGELIIRDAELKARGVLEESRLRTEELRRELTGLRQEKETYLARFRALAESQIQFVDAHRADFEDFDRRLTDIVDVVAARSGPPAPGPAPAGPYAPANPYAAPAPGAWAHPYAQAPAPAAPPYAAPAPHAAPLPHYGAGPLPPAVPGGPAPGRSAGDIWRDYQAGWANPAAPAPAPAHPTAPAANDEAAATVAQVLNEFPAAGPAPAPEAAGDNWRIEPVVTEVTNL